MTRVCLSWRTMKFLTLASILIVVSPYGFGAEPPSRAKQSAIAQEKSADEQMAGKERFENILTAKNEDFDRQRIALFADADAIDYLSQRTADPDPVTAFVARELQSWAVNPTEMAQLDDFLASGVFERKEELNKTAVGWQPAKELERYLVLRNNQQTNRFLLLRLLMTPRLSPTWMYGGAMRYYSNHPVSEPAVWIRKALESGDNAVFDHLANLSLRVTDQSATLRALNSERARCLRMKQPFPPQLEALRKELSQGAGSSR